MNKLTIPKWLYLLFAATLIVACVLPWVHYNSIDKTFNGYNVTKFTSGVYYGKAGIIITVMSLLLGVFMFGKTKTAQFVRIFGTGLLVAYCVRTYLLFTGSLFEGETDTLIGMWMVLIIPFAMLAMLLVPERK